MKLRSHLLPMQLLNAFLRASSDVLALELSLVSDLLWVLDSVFFWILFLWPLIPLYSQLFNLCWLSSSDRWGLDPVQEHCVSPLLMDKAVTNLLKTINNSCSTYKQIFCANMIIKELNDIYNIKTRHLAHIASCMLLRSCVISMLLMQCKHVCA